MFFDVIVIRGGPAGSNCAYNAAKHGLSVALVESRELGGYKTDAGGLSNRALNLVNPKLSVIERRIDSFRLVSPTCAQVFMNCGNSKGATIYRTKFDQYMMERARKTGATLLSGSRAERIVFEENNAIMQLKNGTKYTTSCVVGAFGISSRLYRDLGIKRPEAVMGVELELSMDRELIDKLVGNTLEFYFGSCYTSFGYSWIFPKRDGLSVGLVDCIRSKNKKERLLKFVKEHPIASEKLRDAKPRLFDGQSLHAALIPNCPAEKTSGDRFLLVGDAAGFADPVTREGMYFALKSGELAARTVINAHESADFSSTMLSNYDITWKKMFSNDFDSGKKLQNLLYGLKSDKRWELIISLLNDDENLRRLAGKDLAETMSVSRFLKMLPWTTKLRLFTKDKMRSALELLNLY